MTHDTVTFVSGQYDERQVARKYAISESTFRRMIAAGSSRAYRLGGAAEVDAALAANPVVEA
jgi:excisionase family DNA binding protein